MVTVPVVIVRINHGPVAIFSSKLDYALRALLDLASQPKGHTAQSREIAHRQEIPESYLNQLLVILRRAGLVRSIRGAAGGYTLGRDPSQLSVADVVEALHGDDLLGQIAPGVGGHASTLVVRELQRRLNSALHSEMARTTLASLSAEVDRMDEARSLMLGL